MLIVIIVVAVFLFHVLPETYGNAFVSFSCEVDGYLGEIGAKPYMDVILSNGVNGSCDYIGQVHAREKIGLD